MERSAPDLSGLEDSPSLQESSSSPLTPDKLCTACELPARPVEPSEEACCGQGCNPCVKDIHEQELQLWKKECDRIRSGHRAILSAGVISPDQYTRFELLAVTPEGTSCWRFRFRLPDNTSLPLELGQHLVLRSAILNTVRQYTPVTAADMEGFFEVVIKIYAEGEMSQYIKTWQAGQQVEWRGPLGGITYQPNNFDLILLLVAGTGLTPVLSIIRCVLNNEEDETRLTLLYACRNYSDVICKEELDGYRDYWNFKLVYFVSQVTSSDNIKYGDVVCYERLTEAHIKQELGNYANNSFTYICGTRSFDLDMMMFLRSCGLSEENWHKL